MFFNNIIMSIEGTWKPEEKSKPTRSCSRQTFWFSIYLLPTNLERIQVFPLFPPPPPPPLLLGKRALHSAVTLGHATAIHSLNLSWTHAPWVTSLKYFGCPLAWVWRVGAPRRPDPTRHITWCVMKVRRTKVSELLVLFRPELFCALGRCLRVMCDVIYPGDMLAFSLSWKYKLVARESDNIYLTIYTREETERISRKINSLILFPKAEIINDCKIFNSWKDPNYD